MQADSDKKTAPYAFAGVALAAAAVLFAAGCRDEPPPPPHNTNLGSADRPLLPTESPPRDNAILMGRADIVQLQALDAPADTDDGADSEQADRQAIAELIDAVRARHREKDFEGLAELVVERQRDIVAGSAADMRAASEATEAFVAALEAANPPPPMFAPMAPLLRAALDPPIETDGIVIESPSVATATMLTLPVRFEKEDGEWFMVQPQIAPSADQQIAMAQLMTQLLNDAAAVLGDDSLPGREKDAQLLAVFQKIQAAAVQADDSP